MAFFISLFITFTSVFAFAQQERRKVQEFPYIVTDDIDVYARPEVSEWPVVTLSVGEKLRVLPGEWNGFKKVAFTFKGRTRAGYVLKAQTANLAKNTAKKNFAPSKWVHLGLVPSYQRQGKRDLQTSSDTIYEVSEFTGTSLFLVGGVDFPVNESWQIRTAINMRTVDLEGEAKAEEAIAGQKFSLKYEFIGIELGARHFFSTSRAWSLMGTFEVAKATSAELKVVEGPALDFSKVDLPTFVVMTGGVNYDWRLNQKWAIEFGFRLGGIINAEPAILLAEGLILGKYAL